MIFSFKLDLCERAICHAFCFNILPALRGAKCFKGSLFCKAQLAVFNLVAIPLLMVNMLLVITLVFSFLMSNPNLLEENFSVDTQASVTAVEKLLNLEMVV